MRIYILIFALIIPLFSSAQQKLAIEGEVIDAKNNMPLTSVAVRVVEIDRWYISNNKGKFIFDNLKPYTYTLEFQCLGYEFLTTRVVVPSNKPIKISLQQSSYELEEVVVLETRGVGLSSTSNLNTAAIEHVQPSSLSDIMQLLPGGLIDNPDLIESKSISIREIGTDANSSSGTAVIIDGSPVGNDANMQTFSTTQIQTSSSSVSQSTSFNFSTNIGNGIDQRSVSTDNIESIEVIKGIPSVVYGNLTSGAVVVKTKAGYSPFEIKVKSDPNLKLVSAGKGFKLEKGGSVNLNLDYTSAYKDLRSKYDQYKRITGQVGYSNTFMQQTSPLSFNTKLSFYTTNDQESVDPEAFVKDELYRSNDNGFRLNMFGKWALNNKYISNIKYSFSTNAVAQESYQKKYRSGELQGVSTSLVEGENEGIYLPSESLTELTIKGLPISFFGQITANKHKIFSNDIINNILVGAEYNLSGNYGEGRIYDVTNPPVISRSSSRPRSFKDIPALQSYSFYAEDKISLPISNTTLDIQAGFRMNNFQPTSLTSGDIGIYYEPRLNARYKIVDNKTFSFAIRGGLGINYKAPSLMYMYPDLAYIDLVSLGYYTEAKETQSIIFTTKIFDSTTESLKPAKNFKREVGFDFSFNQVNGNVTAYAEELTDGLGMLTEYQFIDYQQYDTTGITTGVKPDVSMLPHDSASYTIEYSKPSNVKSSEKYGVEYSFNFGKIESLHTTVSLSGAWMRTKRIYTTTTYNHLPSKPSGGQYQYVGVYPAGESKVNERLSSSLRLVTHSPKLRLILTTTLQMLWYDKYIQPFYDKSPVYLYGKDGSTIEFTNEMRNDLAYRDYIKSKSDNYYKTDILPPLFLCNVKLSKELGDKMKLSFYANNFVNYRPVYLSSRTMIFTRRNPEVYFGAEIKITI